MFSRRQLVEYGRFRVIALNYEHDAGFGMPVWTTAQRNTVVSPEVGLTAFNTTLLKLETWDGATWASGSSGSVSPVIVDDGVTNAVSTVCEFRHTTSGTATSGIGAAILFTCEDTAGATENCASVQAVLTDATNGAESSALDFFTRTGGAAMVRAARVHPAGGLSVGYTGTADPATNDGLGLSWARRAIVVRSALDTSWLDVWRVDGSGFWTFGSTSSSSGGVVLLAPSTGEIYLRRSSDTYLGVDASGDLALGLATKPTTLRGSTITITTAPVVAIDDATTNAVTTALTLRHTTTGTAAAGIGTRLLLQSEDAGGTTEDVAALDAVLTNAGAATEASALDVLTRTAGGALRRVSRFTAGGSLLVGASGATQDPGDGGVVVGIAKGYYIESGGTLYNALGCFGGGAMVVGSGSFNGTLAFYSLSVSAGQGTTISNGWFTLAAAAGFRTPPTVVNNTAHTVTANMYTIEVKGLTAARAVTLPAHVAGTRVLVFCSDGSCTAGNKITMTPASGNINGAATFDLTSNYAVCEVISNGTSWTILHTR